MGADESEAAGDEDGFVGAGGAYGEEFWGVEGGHAVNWRNWGVHIDVAAGTAFGGAKYADFAGRRKGTGGGNAASLPVMRQRRIENYEKYEQRGRDEENASTGRMEVHGRVVRFIVIHVAGGGVVVGSYFEMPFRQ